MSPIVNERLLELVSNAIEEKLDVDQVYGGLQSIAAPAEEVMTCLAETIWVLWLKFEGSRHAEKRMRLIELTRSCVRDKKLDRKIAMTVLEPDCMQAVGLIADVEIWRKKEIRYNTRTSYTVAKYNLLREDSEGYAKLLVAINQCGDIAIRPEDLPLLFSEIQSLIGYFDLDPNRVLDLVLGAAESQPWNTAYYGLIPRLKQDAAAHLLGFRFQRYQTPGKGPTPGNLLMLSANLINAGIVPLNDLLGHLWPSDRNFKKAMSARQAALKKAVEAIGVINLNGPVKRRRPGGGNALTNGGPARGAVPGPLPPSLGSGGGGYIASLRAAQAGGMGSGYGGGAPLGGGGAPPSSGGGGFRPVGLSAATLRLDPFKKYARLLLPRECARNQKLALVKALLENQAWKAAAALLARLSRLGMQPCIWKPLRQTLTGILSAELEPILLRLAPRGIAGPSLLHTLTTALAKRGGTAGSVDLRGALPQGLLPGPPLSKRATDAMMAVGPFLSRSKLLLTQCIQAVRHHYLLYAMAPGGPLGSKATAAKGPGAATLAVEATRVHALLSRVLLPAASLVPSNPALSQELWALLKLLPFGTRYKIYAELKGQVNGQPYLSAASRMAVTETKKVLKRVHTAPDKAHRKDVSKPFALLLGKIATANPLPVLETVVFQVEAYSNQMEPIVDALRYLTPMAYDMLTYVVLTRLSMKRQKVKNDGINICDWLQSLAKFIGAVCRKYQDVDIFAICQFLANTLRRGESVDLLVLKDLVETLTGVLVDVELSPDQLEARLGGDALTSLVMMRDTEKSRKSWTRGARRLMDALQCGPTTAHLALPLFILVSQQRQAIMVHTKAQHIKFMVELFDKCHETCQQYLTFLQSALPHDEYARLMPSITALRSTYKLDPEIVFMAHRPQLRRLLDAVHATTAPAEEGEIEEGHGSARSAGAASKSGASSQGAAREAAEGAWQKILAEVHASLPNQAAWQGLTPDLYTLFWTLAVHDIYVPNKTYGIEIEKAKAELRSIESSLSSMRGGGGMGMSGQSVEDEVADLNRQRDRLKDLIKRMPVEQEAQAVRVEAVKQLITRIGDRLVVPVPDKKMMARMMIQECVLPRVLFGPQDASFCAKFVQLLSAVSVPFFSTVWYYNQLLKDVVPALRCVTDREAVNMGCFLLETLKLLNYWRSDEKVYDEECGTKPGFSISLTEPSEKKTSYDQYKRLVYKWHNMMHLTLRACLESAEYTSRRNALTILTRLLPVHPIAEGHVAGLRRSLEKLRAEETREDLAVLIKSYSAAFGAETAKEGRVIPDPAFGAPVKAKKPGPGGRPGAAAAKRPAASAGTTSGQAAPGADVGSSAKRVKLDPPQEPPTAKHGPAAVPAAAPEAPPPAQHATAQPVPPPARKREAPAAAVAPEDPGGASGAPQEAKPAKRARIEPPAPRERRERERERDRAEKVERKDPGSRERVKERDRDRERRPSKEREEAPADSTGTNPGAGGGRQKRDRDVVGDRGAERGHSRHRV